MQIKKRQKLCGWLILSQTCYERWPITRKNPDFSGVTELNAKIPRNFVGGSLTKTETSNPLGVKIFYLYETRGFNSTISNNIMEYIFCSNTFLQSIFHLERSLVCSIPRRFARRVNFNTQFSSMFWNLVHVWFWWIIFHERLFHGCPNCK